MKNSEYYIVHQSILPEYFEAVARYEKQFELRKNDRDFYFDLKDLPFSVAENNDELETNILKFNQKLFENDLVKFFKNVGLKENGNATEIASKQIETWMNL